MEHCENEEPHAFNVTVDGATQLYRTNDSKVKAEK